MFVVGGGYEMRRKWHTEIKSCRGRKNITDKATEWTVRIVKLSDRAYRKLAKRIIDQKWQKSFLFEFPTDKYKWINITLLHIFWLKYFRNVFYNNFNLRYFNLNPGHPKNDYPGNTIFFGSGKHFFLTQ